MPARTRIDNTVVEKMLQNYCDTIPRIINGEEVAYGAAAGDSHLQSWREEKKYGYTSPLIQYVDQSFTCDGNVASCRAKLIRRYASFAGERDLLRELLILKVTAKLNTDGKFHEMEHSHYNVPKETHQGFSPCSQISQDSWVLQRFPGLREGFYLEVGANHATELSNTHFLQMGHRWKGICIEPFPQESVIGEWDSRCKDGSCELVRKAVGDGSTVTFVAPGHVLGGFLDKVDISRVTQQANSNQVQVDTQPLQTMLLRAQNQPPLVDDNAVAAKNDPKVRVIHYLSLDTEGTEYDILQQVLDPAVSEHFKVLSISVEHNYKGCSQDGLCAGNYYDAKRNGRDFRTAIRDLLKENGYVLDVECQHDDFYLLKNYKSYVKDNSVPQSLPKTMSR